MENTPPLTDLSPQTGDKKKIIIVVTIIVLVGLFAFFLFYALTKRTRTPAPTPVAIAVPTPATFRPSKVDFASDPQLTPGQTKLLNTDYGPYAHEVFPGPISSASTQALREFTIENIKQSDGSTKIIATIKAAGYGPMEIIVKPGQTAYLVTPASATSAVGQDVDLGDNFLVVVDSQGRVVLN